MAEVVKFYKLYPENRYGRYVPNDEVVKVVVEDCFSGISPFMDGIGKRSFGLALGALVGDGLMFDGLRIVANGVNVSAEATFGGVVVRKVAVGAADRFMGDQEAVAI